MSGGDGRVRMTSVKRNVALPAKVAKERLRSVVRRKAVAQNTSWCGEDRHVLGARTRVFWAGWKGLDLF